MDKIISQFVRNFEETKGVSFDKPEKSFEAFVNYCIGSQSFIGDFDFNDISTNGQGEVGIDGVAVVVNEHLVLSESDIDYFKNNLGRFDVRFVFVQSKTSAKFDLGDMAKFFFGVQSFFKENSIHKNEKIKRSYELKEYIYENAVDMEKNPECELFYVTLGEWVGDKVLQHLVDENLNILKEQRIFSLVKFTPIDAEATKRIYRSLRSKIQKTVKFERHTILPTIDNVQTAYIGVLPSLEYLKLITNDEGKLDRRLFYDNVRDFQGNNTVNLEIASTLQEIEKKRRFVLLNNGVTIVAKFANQTGATFNIRDFQIVNGCQTSHVLFNNRDILTDEIYLTIKLIVTEDQEIANSITEATNSQTEVRKEAFESLSSFHKKLEEFYESFDDPEKKLYYERRSKQYEDVPNVKPERIINIAVQLKSFLSMFINNPHITHRYYGNLLEKHSSQLFLDSHALFPYYTSSYAFYTLDRMFANKKIDQNLKLFRYHILLIFRIQNESESLPPLNNTKKIDRYCENLVESLWDENKSLKSFQQAITTLQKALKDANVPWNDAVNSKSFTESIVALAKQKSHSDNAGAVATVEREIGRVRDFGTHGYGFIEYEENVDVFVHWRDIREIGYKSLNQGVWVSYVKVPGEKGYFAKDVEKLGYGLVVINQTAHPIILAIRYKHHSGNWTTDGWWKIDGKTKTDLLLSDEDMEMIICENYLYYYAQVQVEIQNESNLKWIGEHPFEFKDDRLLMKKTNLNLGINGEYILIISAENSTLVEE